MSQINQNNSYETLLKQLQVVYNQSQENSQAIQNKQPDNSKVFLDPNWLQNIVIVDDTRDAITGLDEPIVPIMVIGVVPNFIIYSPGTSLVSVSSHPSPGPMPMTFSYKYSNTLSGITKTLVPFLEFENSFSAPNGNMTLTAGTVFNADFWVNQYTIIANGVTIWDGYEAPFASEIQVSQFQIDNGYTDFYIPCYNLTWVSNGEGGVYGSGHSTGGLILTCYNETTSTSIPIDDDFLTNMEAAKGLGNELIFEIWSNSDEFSFSIDTSFLISFMALPETNAYIAMWPDMETPFYIYEDFISAGVDLYLQPPVVLEMTSPLSPITFTINSDGPTRYSAVVGAPAVEYVPASSSTDPYYVRLSKSIAAEEIWQVNCSSAGVVNVNALPITSQQLPVYNDTYTWDNPNWVRTPNHTLLTLQTYQPPAYDMTARVRVAIRPPINWKKTDKYT